MHCVSLSKLRRLFLPKLRCFPKNKRSFLKFERFFCPNEGVLQNKKKRSFLKFERFFCPNEGVLQKKKKKVFTKTGTLFWQWSAQISRLFAQTNRPFAQIFDVLNRMGGRPPPCPPASYGYALIQFLQSI